MKAYVIDVNVPIVASSASSHANLECIAARVRYLRDVMKQGMVVLDRNGYVLQEYLRKLTLKGEPGVGQAFVRWMWERQAVARRCEIVHLNEKPGQHDDCEEFPDDPRLQMFDRNDRKYVAVARASHRRPVVLNAVDSDWWYYRDVLKEHGVRVRFLCPQHMNRRHGS